MTPTEKANMDAAFDELEALLTEKEFCIAERKRFAAMGLQTDAEVWLKKQNALTVKIIGAAQELDKIENAFTLKEVIINA